MKYSANKALAILFAISLFVSLFGAIAAIDKFGGFKALTGAWSDNVTTTHSAVNITVNTNLLINFTDDTANFGSGYICSGCSGATIATDQTNSSCNCGWLLPTGLILENTGNRNAAVLLSNTNYTNSMLGGTLSGYAWKWETPKTSGAASKNTTCIGGNLSIFGSIFENYTNITAIYDAAGNYTICDVFNYSDTSDIINISIKFHIDQSARATNLPVSDTWTAVARDAG